MGSTVKRMSVAKLKSGLLQSTIYPKVLKSDPLSGKIWSVFIIFIAPKTSQENVAQNFPKTAKDTNFG